MNLSDRSDVLRLIELIMSAKSREEQQKEALQYLTSTGNQSQILVNAKSPEDVKRSNNLTPKEPEERSKCTGFDRSSIGALEAIGLFSSMTKSNPTEYDISNDLLVSCKQRYIYDHIQTSCDSPGSSHMKEDQCKSTVPIKKRKSKYCNIQGDLSSINKKPKTSKATSDDIPKIKQEKKQSSCCHFRQTKSNRKSEKPNRKSQRSKSTSDILLVRRLIKMLQYPESRQQQECVVALLRSDSKLREKFLAEKKKIGKVIIPVFRQPSRQSTTRDVNHCAYKTDNIGHIHQIDESGIDANKHDRHNEQITDAFIKLLEYSANTEKSSPCHNEENRSSSSARRNASASDCTLTLQDVPTDSNDTCTITVPVNDQSAYDNVNQNIIGDDSSPTSLSSLDFGWSSLYPVTYSKDDDQFQQLANDLYYLNNVQQNYKPQLELSETNKQVSWNYIDLLMLVIPTIVLSIVSG